MSKKFFASDNCSGIHPQIMQAIMEANSGHVKGYGYDPYTDCGGARLQAIVWR
jgi:threonine aldolase